MSSVTLGGSMFAGSGLCNATTNCGAPQPARSTSGVLRNYSELISFGHLEREK